MALLELYLIRHGIAAERGEEYPDDSKRPLTSTGMTRVRQEARALNALKVGFDVIISSPLVRTKQTAEIIAGTLKEKPAIVTSDALAPAGTPNLGELAARLIGARSPIQFKKGAICRIDFEILPPKSLGQLQWFVTPRMLRRMR